jgi:hypothetical protein
MELVLLAALLGVFYLAVEDKKEKLRQEEREADKKASKKAKKLKASKGKDYINPSI